MINRITALLFLIGLAWGQTTKSFSIELLNERNFPSTIDTNGVYHITISGKQQSIFKMKGVTGSNMTEKITWKVKDKLYWSDGIRTDFYPVINPSSYAKNGVGYSMVGFLPEMKGKLVVIYGTYNNQTDSVRVMVE